MKKKVIKKIALIVGLLTVAAIALFMVKNPSNESKPKEVKASSVVLTRDFRLNVDNKWDNTAKKNYADVKWDDVPDLSQSGYRMYQSEDGNNWHMRSTSFGKQVKVLNIYPDSTASNTLKGWMDSLNLKTSDGTNHIEVTPMPISTFNANPAGSLKDGSGKYKYDVVFIGTHNSNNSRDLTAVGVDEIIDFMETGRGFLAGHETIIGNAWFSSNPSARPYQLPKLADYVGIKVIDQRVVGTSWPVSSKVKLVNNGYLMKYPFELENNLTFTIPLTHSFGQIAGSKYGGEIWMQFQDWYPADTGKSIAPDNPDETTNFYLVTKNNGGIIQTGHSTGQTTEDERKILANTLINLSQATMDTYAQDHTVKDDQAPEAPETSIRCGTDGKLSVKVDANDIGKEYQWYIEADTVSSGKKKSDIVKEEIKSNTAGYFYEVSDSPTSNLDDQVKALKDAYGRIDPADYDVYVAPDTDAVTYETAGAFTINEKTDSTKYVHTVAVDRANNVSTVSSKQIKDLAQPVDFEVERTADEAKLVELALDPSISPKMKSVEIQIPKNTEIKDFSSLTLPADWYSFENSETADYYSFTFAMETNNSIATIKTFLEELRFTIKSPVNDSGNIKVIFHEKVYTSWIDGEGKTHYYAFIPEMTAPGKNWFEAYNGAKTHTYRGLTGYLATITSLEEHNFIFDNIAKEPGWLGGTRGRFAGSGKKINDEATISTTVSPAVYDVLQDQWYWANGPETGEEFYIGKHWSSASVPPGAYSGFGPGEPNNNWYGNAEYCIQFAKAGVKDWNDLPGGRPYDIDFNKGYYVEFSEYGTQKEKEEVTDLCWSAAIPQKISLKAYDEATGGALTAGDQLFDQELRIGKAITVKPNDLEYYTYIEIRELDDSVRGLNYNVTDTYQEGKLIYALRRANLHVRQVILDPMSELVVPSKGYLTIRNQLDNGGSPALDPDYQGNVSVTSGKQADTPGFTDFGISASHLPSALDQVLLSVVVPEFYHYEGYYLTEEVSDPNGASHAANTSITTGEIALDRARIEDKEEFWITVYLKPVEDDQGEAKVPQPYSWDYKKNDLGKIKTKTP